MAAVAGMALVVMVAPIVMSCGVGSSSHHGVRGARHGGVVRDHCHGPRHRRDYG